MTSVSFVSPGRHYIDLASDSVLLNAIGARAVSYGDGFFDFNLYDNTRMKLKAKSIEQTVIRCN